MHVSTGKLHFINIYEIHITCTVLLYSIPNYKVMQPCIGRSYFRLICLAMAMNLTHNECSPAKCLFVHENTHK